MKLYDDFKDRRDEFEVLAFHDARARDLADLDAKLVEVKKKFWGGRDLPFPILMDHTGSTIRTYGISSFPTVLVIDPDGKVMKGAGEWTVRQHLLKTSKKVKAHRAALTAAKDEAAFRSAVTAIVKAGGETGGFALYTFANETELTVDQLAAVSDGFRKMGGRWARGFFMGKYGIGSKEAATRKAAAETLGEIGDRSLLGVLVQVVNRESDPAVKAALHAAITKLNGQ